MFTITLILRVCSLSSLLYTTTRNATYLELAAISIQFAKTFLSDPSGTMFFDTFNFGSCTLARETFTYDGGYFLQALVAYYGANMTSATASNLE